jgi:hypothetical protein
MAYNRYFYQYYFMVCEIEDLFLEEQYVAPKKIIKQNGKMLFSHISWYSQTSAWSFNRESFCQTLSTVVSFPWTPPPPPGYRFLQSKTSTLDFFHSRVQNDTSSVSRGWWGWGGGVWFLNSAATAQFMKGCKRWQDFCQLWIV